MVNALCAQSQERDSLHKATSKKYSARFIVHAGVIAGAAERAPLVQGIAGLQLKPLFVGIGAGFDAYYLKSMPLFMHLEKSISQRSPFYIYSEIGMNSMWWNKKIETGWQLSKYQSGLYYDAGIGTAFFKKARTQLLLSAGYSLKKMKYENITNRNAMPPASPQVYAEQYVLRRYVFKAGMRF